MSSSYSKQNLELAVIKAYYNEETYDPIITENGIKKHLQEFLLPIEHIQKIKIIPDKSKAYITFNDYQTYLQVLRMSFTKHDREQCPGSHPFEYIPIKFDSNYTCQKTEYYYHRNLNLFHRLNSKINTLQNSINELQNNIDIIHNNANQNNYQNNYNSINALQNNQNNYKHINQNNYKHINNNLNHNNNNTNQKQQIHLSSELSDTLKGFTEVAELLTQQMINNNQNNIQQINNNDQQQYKNNNNNQTSPTQNNNK